MTVQSLRDLRATPIEVLERQYWSQGKPALPTPVRPSRDEWRDPAEAQTVAELLGMTPQQYAEATPAQLARAAERMEPPSIARSAWLAGCRVDSLDRVVDTEDGTATLAEMIPADDPRYDTLATIVDPADMTPEQRAAYEAFSAEFAGRHAPIVLTNAVLDPAVRDRIEWERWMRRCGDVKTEGFRISDDGERVTFFSLVGRRLSREEFLQRKQAFVADFLARTGLDKVPSAAEFIHKRKTYAMLRNVRAFDDLIDAGRALAEALMPEPEPIDDDGRSREVIDEPYIPSFATLMLVAEREMGACAYDPKRSPTRNARAHRAEVHRRASARLEALIAKAEAEGPQVQVRFRSARDADRYHRGDVHDALWQSGLGEDEVAPYLVTLGTLD